MKEILKKIGISLGVLLLCLGFCFIVKTNHDISVGQQNIQDSVVQMKQLADGMVRSQSQYVSKDELNKFSKDLGLNLDAIRADLKGLGANLEGINTFIASTSGYHGSNLPSTTTHPNDNPQPIDYSDPFGYLKNIQLLSLNEPVGSNNVPFGQATFSAWQAKPWGIDIYPRTYTVNTILGQDVEGRHSVISKFQVTTQGKTYEVPIKESKFEEVLPAASVSFNPKVGLAINGGYNISKIAGSVSPTAYVSFASYGQTKPKPILIFPVVGVGFDSFSKTGNVAINPVMYNLGQVVPFINNTYVGPGVSVGFDKSVSVFGSVFVTF